MVNKNFRDAAISNILICWAGWLTLGLVEAGLRFTIDPPPLALMIFLTIFIYSLVGVIAGLIYSALTLLIQPLCRGLKAPFHAIHFSMAVCIATILSVSALIFFIKSGLYENTPRAFFKSALLFAFIIAMLSLLPFFFSWMDRKGKLFIAYLSILPSLWIIASLRLTRSKELFPSVLQITTFSRTLLLIMCSLICFFLLYVVFSLGRRLLKGWNFTPLLKASLIILPSLVLVWFLFFFFRDEAGRGTIRAIKNAPRGKPNVVLITLDTTRADHLSCYGYGKPTTPNLDTFSREGVLYKNAYATAPWTIPSHASIFTGKYPTRHGAHYDPHYYEKALKILSANTSQQIALMDYMMDQITQSIFPLPEENITLAETLAERGYRTAGIIGGYMCSSIFGLAQGFDYYNERFFNIEKDIKFSLICQAVNLFFPLNDFLARQGYSLGKRIASDLNKTAFAWLEKNHTQPFFLFINYFDPHDPYLPPPPFDESFGKTDKSVIMNRNSRLDSSYIKAEWDLAMSVIHDTHQLTSAEKELLLSRYDGEISYLDHHLGLLFERLRALKVFDNTLIVVVGDHGEAFGEHNLMYHKLALYEGLIRVPLIIKYPSSSRRGVEEKRVSLVDLMPTILAYLDYPVPSDIDGKILEDASHPVIAEEDACWWLFKKFPRSLKAIYEGQYKYIWASDGLHELYDLGKDPREEGNLYQQFPSRAEAMEERLNLWLTSFTPPKTGEKKVKVDRQTVDAMRALGYIR